MVAQLKTLRATPKNEMYGLDHLSGWHVTLYRGAVGPNINYQSCWVWYKDQNGTPHGGSISSWRYEALKTQPLTPVKTPQTPYCSPWGQKGVLV